MFLRHIPRTLFALTAIIALAIAPLAQAAENGQTLQELKREMMTLQQQFMQLQKETIGQSETLQEGQEALKELTDEKLAEAGFDSSNQQKVESIKQTLQDPEASQEAKMTAKRELQSIQQSFQVARQSIGQDEELRKEQKGFQDQLMEQMKEDHPNLDALIEKMQKAGKELQAIIDKQRQSQSGAARAPTR